MIMTCGINAYYRGYSKNYSTTPASWRRPRTEHYTYRFDPDGNTYITGGSWGPQRERTVPGSRVKIYDPAKEPVTVRSLYRKAALFALNEFWDLKVYTMNMKRKCDSILQLNNKTEIQNLRDGPLNEVTEPINTQIDHLAMLVLENVTTVEEIVEPVKKGVVESILEGLQQMNRTILELGHGFEKESNEEMLLMDIMNDVNMTNKKLNSYYERTTRYLNRVKTEMQKGNSTNEPYNTNGTSPRSVTHQYPQNGTGNPNLHFSSGSQYPSNSTISDIQQPNIPPTAPSIYIGSNSSNTTTSYSRS